MVSKRKPRIPRQVIVETRRKWLRLMWEKTLHDLKAQTGQAAQDGRPTQVRPPQADSSRSDG